MSVRAEGVTIDSFADFMRVTNTAESHSEKNGRIKTWIFWAPPAFKIRPKLFLIISNRLTPGAKAVER